MRFFFRKKMPNEQHNCPRFFQIKEEAMKIRNDMAQLRVNPHIIEQHKTLFIFRYKYKIKLLRNELFELQKTKCYFL